MRALEHLRQSVLSVLALTALAGATVALAVWPAPGLVVGILVLVLVAGQLWVVRRRPGPVVDAVAVAGLLAAVLALLAHDESTTWVALTAAVATVAGLMEGPVRERLVPRVRAVGLPGVPSDPRPEETGPLPAIAPGAAALLAVLLVLGAGTDLPGAASAIVLLLVLLACAGCVVWLRSQVEARRDRTVNRRLTEALTAYAPQFYIYFSGPAEGDYQIRMWLPWLERVGVPFAVLAREQKMLPRAAALTSAPVVMCPRISGLDDCMVPSVRAMFYVNTDRECVDGVRYLDVTHVHLNHGDSDKPSSYHPMISMFDQVFLAGQAAVDRFARNGVVVPAEKLVLVGRPQVADIAGHNVEPLPGCRTVLYAPTWRGGVRDMNFSSLMCGEQIVRLLLDRGVRVMFRPHPLSCKETRSADAITRIDALLAAAATPAYPHLGSAQTRRGGIAEAFNRSDALVTDVSSVASDYLQSGKPMAVADLAGTGHGQPADADAYPVLRAAYVLDLAGDAGAALDTMLGADPLEQRRGDLRSYFLGDHPDSALSFVEAASRALRAAGTPGGDHSPD